MPRRGTPSDTPHPDIVKRAATITKTTKLMVAHFIKRQVNDAKLMMNGSDTTSILGAPIGSWVLVYRKLGATGTS